MPVSTRTVYVIHFESRLERRFRWYPDTTSHDVLMGHVGKAIEKAWSSLPQHLTHVRLVQCNVPSNRTGAQVTDYLELACQWSMTRGPALVESTVHADSTAV